MSQFLLTIGEYVPVSSDNLAEIIEGEVERCDQNVGFVIISLCAFCQEGFSSVNGSRFNNAI